ncbi:MAG: putative molybdopterin biosynthesis protein moeA, partial [Pseudomonadota bacterium]
MKSLAQVAAQLQGYDPQALRADAALQFLQGLVSPVVQHHQVELKQALERILATDVISPINVPAHDNSAMDGFAFDGTQLQTTQALHLTIVGTALAGKAWQGTVEAGQCVKIMTGAVMPAGLDTVVPQELTQQTGNTISIAPGVLQRGDNRRFMGEDLMQGKAAVTAGSRVT